MVIPTAVIPRIVPRAIIGVVPVILVTPARIPAVPSTPIKVVAVGVNVPIVLNIRDVVLDSITTKEIIIPLVIPLVVVPAVVIPTVVIVPVIIPIVVSPIGAITTNTIWTVRPLDGTG